MDHCKVERTLYLGVGLPRPLEYPAVHPNNLFSHSLINNKDI